MTYYAIDSLSPVVDPSSYVHTAATVIGDVIIGAAMSFVKAGAEIPARHLAAGTPAKILRELSDAEIAWKEAGTADYQRLTRRCFETLNEVIH